MAPQVPDSTPVEVSKPKMPKTTEVFKLYDLLEKIIELELIQSHMAQKPEKCSLSLKKEKKKPLNDGVEPSTSRLTVARSNQLS